VKFKKRRPPPPFIGGARLFGKPAIQQGAALRETRNPTVRRQSTVTSKTPAEPLRARAALSMDGTAFELALLGAIAGGLFKARTVGAKCWNLLSWAS
jgi:hypothetical protein